jgi:hypothetical protein
MKIELDADETWELLSVVVARLAGGASLPDKDRAALRRWRSDSMQPGSEPVRLLTRKINGDLAEAQARQKRSPIRKPDWR